MSDHASATESTDVAPTPKPGLIARVAGLFRRAPVAEHPDELPGPNDGAEVTPSLLGRILARFGRQAKADNHAATADAAMAGESGQATPEAGPPKVGGIGAFVRSQVLLIVILAGVVVVGVAITLVVMVVVKQRKAETPKVPPVVHSAPAKGDHPAADTPSAHTVTDGQARPAGVSPTVAEGAAHAPPKAEPDHAPAPPPLTDSIAEARQQLEAERAQLAAEKKALEEARKAFEAQKTEKQPTATTPKRAVYGNCNLSGSDPASIREELRRCLGLPDKPAESPTTADNANPTDPAKPANKAAAPPAKPDGH